MDNKKLKQEQRALIKNKRQALNKDYIQQAATACMHFLSQHVLLKDKLNIASYVSYKGELDTYNINNMLLAQGHNLSLPLISTTTKGEMSFYQINDYYLLKHNQYGILEPDALIHKKIDIGCLNVILVPLIGFDKQGNRLGMGGGYYDRLLKKLSYNCVTIGLAYDFQEFDTIQYERWDMPLDEIITPCKHLKITQKY